MAQLGQEIPDHDEQLKNIVTTRPLNGALSLGLLIMLLTPCEALKGQTGAKEGCGFEA